jgi:hypothetical protein
MGIIQRVFAPGSRDADSTPLLRQAVFTLGFATLAALALLPEEFEHYRRLLRLPEDAGMRIRITLIIGAKTLAMLSAGLGIAGLLAWRGHLASARNLSLIWSLLVVAYVVLDLSLQRLTGNHIFDYLVYLQEPETLHWAGTGLDVRSVLAQGFGLAAGFSLLAWLGAKWLSRRPRAAALGLTIVWVVFLPTGASGADCHHC